MNLKLPLLLICCQALFAQGSNAAAQSAPSASSTTEHAKIVVKVVRVQGDAEVLATLAGKGADVNYQVNNALKAIVLKGSETSVEKVERTIQELDSLGPVNAAVSGLKNVELTTYVIAGSMEPILGVEEASGEALAPVVKQLRAIFSYKRYQLLSTILIRSAQNTPGGVTGVLGPLQVSDASANPVTYRIMYESIRTSGETAQIHVAKLHFSASVPYMVVISKAGSPTTTTQYRNHNIGIDADVDLREGQKVVVGTSNVAQGNTCIFLVLSARLVQ